MVVGRAMISHNRPCITAEDRAAVDAVLASGWLAQGVQIESLEASFSEYYHGGCSIAVSSGTAALYMALKALEIGAGAKVAVPAYACSALLNAIYMVGATPSIVDVLPDSFCLGPDALARQAADARCVIAVHTYGAEAAIQSLKMSADVVIEDCCHSLGGRGQAGLLGQVGDAAVFSFYATKIVTGGQGGLVWSRNPVVAERVRDYREFDCRESYEPRFNFQMTDIQGALVSSQMQRIDQIRERRRHIADLYLDALPPGLSAQSGLMDADRMIYRFVVIAPNLVTRESLRMHLEEAGIGCAVPIERYELLSRYLNLDPADYPVSERLVETTLSLPIHIGLTDEQIQYIATSLMRFQL